MPKFPVDAPQAKVIKALQKLGFRLVREGNPFPCRVKTLTGRKLR